jgi:hypothetical protein
MDPKLSRFHRSLLWAAALTGGVLGLAYFFVPGPAATTLGFIGLDFLAIRTIGGFFLGEAVGAGLALRSGQWSEVRIVTIYIATWNILNSVALFYAMLFKGQSFVTMPYATLTALLGLGLAFIAWQRRSG